MHLYLIRNTVNGKGYIGITQQKPYRRWSAHHTRALKGQGFLLAKAIRKYGMKAFTFTVIAQASSLAELLQMEREAIQEFQTFAMTGHGYNLTLGGEGPSGQIQTPEMRQRMVRTRKARGSWQSEESIQRMAATKRGRIRSAAEQEALAKAQASIRGKPHTAEHRQRISEGLRGRKLSEESRAKMSVAHKGLIPWNKGRTGYSLPWAKDRTVSDEVRQKLSIAAKGRVPPNKGQSTPDEVRRKISLGVSQSTKIKRKPVMIDGKIYASIKEAAEKTGATINALRWALKKGRAKLVHAQNEGVL